MHEPSKEDFLKHVAKHELTVLLDAANHRHLQFREPGTGNRHFNLVTWPGYLAFSGDMGCFVFERLADMFEFFRPSTSERDINPGYWSEKVEATDRNGGTREFRAELYWAAIKADFSAWDIEDKETRQRAWDAIEAADLLQTPDSHEDAVSRVMAYQCPFTGLRFVDFYDHTLTDYTYRFIWACYAIQWGIVEYDRAKQHAAAVA